MARSRPGAVPSPFNTARHHTRYRATAFGLPIRTPGATLRPDTARAFEGHGPRQPLRSDLRSLYDHHTHISRTPYGWVRTALQTPVQRHASTAPGIRPAQAFGLVASGLALGHDGTHAAYGVLATDYGGARHVPPLRPSPKGARLPGSAPACRRSVVSNASSDPACGSSAAKRAAHLPLIGGQYRSLPRKGVALVQAITIPPSKEVGPLRDRGI
jgi:hypothetical protein